MVLFPLRRGDALAKVCALMVPLLALSILGQRASSETRSANLLPWRIERDIQRFKFVGTDNIMELLAIRPGMTILDIGAGTGQFAYEFARRLNGTGAVYATDTQAYCVDYMRREAERRGLGNLHPVLVRKDGVDASYGREKYDLITVFHVLMPYEHRVEYFRELRGYLAEGGRLILILEKSPTPLSPGDFTGDFRGLIKELSLEPLDSPFYMGLKDSTRRLIRDNPEGEPPETLRRAIVADFNEMMSDTRFGPHFLNGRAFRNDVKFSPDERKFADWLLLSFVDRNVFGRDIKTLGEAGSKKIMQINKLLIMQRFRKFLKKDGMFQSGMTPPIKAAFEKAGYRLEHEYPDAIPFEGMSVFSAR